MRLGEKLGVVTTHKQLDEEELLRIRHIEQEARRREAHSLMAALEQRIHRGVQNTIASRNVEEAYEPNKNFYKCCELAYWDTEMLQTYIMFIMHKLHPSRVQVEFWIGKVDLANKVIGNFLRPNTEYYNVCTKLLDVCTKLLDRQHFCHYLFERYSRKIKDKEMKDHANSQPRKRSYSEGTNLMLEITN